MSNVAEFRQRLDDLRATAKRQAAALAPRYGQAPAGAADYCWHVDSTEHRGLFDGRFDGTFDVGFDGEFDGRFDSTEDREFIHQFSCQGKMLANVDTWQFGWDRIKGTAYLARCIWFRIPHVDVTRAA